MSYFLNAEEVFHADRLIEQNGAKFYQLLSDETKDEVIKKVCRKLKEDEKRHGQIFEKLLKEYLAKQPAILADKDFPQDDASYLKSLADSNVFARDLSPKEISSKIKTDQETVRFAIKIEKDSINFYSQIKKFTRSDWGGAHQADKIILEEQEHAKILNKLLDDKINPRETC